jgi:hypothetical protein
MTESSNLIQGQIIVTTSSHPFIFNQDHLDPINLLERGFSFRQEKSCE